MALSRGTDETSQCNDIWMLGSGCHPQTFANISPRKAPYQKLIFSGVPLQPANRPDTSASPIAKENAFYRVRELAKNRNTRNSAKVTLLVFQKLSVTHNIDCNPTKDNSTNKFVTKSQHGHIM